MLGQKENSLILFFIDGLGIGDRTEDNPLHMIKGLDPLPQFDGKTSVGYSGGIFVPTDACLGIDGRPQSASGQTTIYTGINAAAHLGFHKQGFPNARLRDLLSQKSIFKQLALSGIGPCIFANTYTPRFFEMKPRWKSATTCAVEAAGLRFCRIPDLLGRKSLFHDFTNRTLIEKGFDVPEFSPEEGAEVLAGLAEENRFVLYEHFITDKIGHDRDWERARSHLPALALLIRETLRRIDLSRTTFILTSDHGNIEDLSIRNHTRNLVPTMIWGRNSRGIANRISSLCDITPAILETLNG